MATLLRVVRLSIMAISLVCCIAEGKMQEYPADNDQYFLWLGRYIKNGSGGVSMDVEGASAMFTVANATYVGCRIADRSAGGARVGSYMNTNISAGLDDPNPSGRAMPNIRTAIFLTSPMQDLYTMGSGLQISGLTIQYTLHLLSEWQMIADRPGELLTVLSFLTDGVLLPAPPRPARRLVVLGDSLSSGVGAGFNVPPSGAPCGSGVPQDDVAATWGSLLCASFGAECEIVAASGITITANAKYNLPLVFPYSLGAMGMSTWPESTRVPWEFAKRPADAVLVELGENDCHALDCSATEVRERLADAYVSFLTNISKVYNQPKLPFFLTLASHEAGQSAAMELAIPRLTSQGYSVMLLNATVPDAVNGTSINNGCAGHPSAMQNQLAFQRARPIVAAVLGWK